MITEMNFGIPASPHPDELQFSRFQVPLPTQGGEVRRKGPVTQRLSGN